MARPQRRHNSRERSEVSGDRAQCNRPSRGMGNGDGDDDDGGGVNVVVAVGALARGTSRRGLRLANIHPNMTIMYSPV
ncbi:unnamed protein product [Heligmosomoides polygyrus]|uniref:Uncharacterized protein n=1 Tax=Heligmosomoides polygyrus TaxID=6339 RepID=A0A183GB16_HELPZ|nr:unnamed protein product [Heligmosomoides polygyrus]